MFEHHKQIFGFEGFFPGGIRVLRGMLYNVSSTARIFPECIEKKSVTTTTRSAQAVISCPEPTGTTYRIREVNPSTEVPQAQASACAPLQCSALGSRVSLLLLLILLLLLFFNNILLLIKNFVIVITIMGLRCLSWLTRGFRGCLGLLRSADANAFVVSFGRLRFGDAFFGQLGLHMCVSLVNPKPYIGLFCSS